MAIEAVGTDDVLGVLTPIWRTKNETASRVRGRIERILDAAKAKTAADPDLPDMAMCHDLAAVEDAQHAAARSVRESLCERNIDGQKLLCAFHDRCGMQRQREAKATVWLVPHALLFQAQSEYIPAPTLS